MELRGQGRSQMEFGNEGNEERYRRDSAVIGAAIGDWPGTGLFFALLIFALFSVPELCIIEP